MFLNGLKAIEVCVDKRYLSYVHEQNSDPRRTPNSQRQSAQEIRLRLAELDSDDWLDNEEPLTIHEKALLEARLAAYAKDPDTGSTWEEVEGRIRAGLTRQPNR